MDELNATRIELATTTTIIGTLADGSARKKAEISKKKVLEGKLSQLELLEEKRSPQMVVEQEYDKEVLIKRKEVAEDFLAALVARKAELTNPNA